MTDDPAKPPRFPYIAALLCAACLGGTVWTWMMYSYVWDVRPHDPRLGPLRRSERETPGSLSGWRGRYVRVSGVYHAVHTRDLYGQGPLWAALRSGDEGDGITLLLQPPEPSRNAAGKDVIHTGSSKTECTLTGRLMSHSDLTGAPWRVYIRTEYLVLNERCSRFAGASIAGLVVGAMGVFVFAVALRHWLKERRKFLEDTKGHNQGMDRTSDV